MKATVIGARGYLGRELVKILLTHPEIEHVLPVSRSEEGQTFGTHVPQLAHKKDLLFVSPDDAAVEDSDIVFLSIPAGEADAFVEKHEELGVNACIDLSRDHRLEAMEGKNGWTYGLADVYPVEKGTRRIANPGCYPTASLLAMTPALKNGLVALGPVIVDGKSGVSGAGIHPRADLHYPEMNESTRAYKVLGHDHTYEIQAGAKRLSGTDRPIRFTPHLIPQTRGLLSTVYLPMADQDADVKEIYAAEYQDSRFVRFVDEANTGNVRGSNYADVAIDVDNDTGLLVARGAIDNLVKGGSGTAVQNMNCTLGLPADLGLEGGFA